MPTHRLTDFVALRHAYNPTATLPGPCTVQEVYNRRDGVVLVLVNGQLVHEGTDEDVALEIFTYFAMLCAYAK